MQAAPVLLAMVGVPLYVIGSFVSGFVSGDVLPSPQTQETTLTFVGDMMFDRYVRERADVMGYDAIFGDTRTLFASSTHLFGNLEGPITSFSPVSSYRDPGPDHYRFTFATTVAATLADVGFSAVSLSNNHTTNFGTAGVLQTKTWLLSSGVGYVGSPDDLYTPWRSDDGTIAVYAYTPWFSPDTEALIDMVRAEEPKTFVVLLAHWGDEYETTPNAQQMQLAHAFVDAGTDLIIGSHPHVIQSKERYNGTWIYYSLGNFIFDQYFSDDVRCGAVISVTQAKGEIVGIDESFITLANDGTTHRSSCKDGISTL